MPRQRSEKRERALKLWLDSNGMMLLKDIAAEIGVSDAQVRKWKKEDDWESVLNSYVTNQKVTGNSYVTNGDGEVSSDDSTKKDSINADVAARGSASHGTNTKRRGGQPGNRNAEGNRGGKGGPAGNKNALTTGEYETVFFTPDIFDEEEMALLDIEVNKHDEQSRLIKTLRIREKRMLVRIAALKNTQGGMVFDSVTKNKSTTTTAYTKADGDKGSSNTVTENSSSHVAVPVLAEIMRIEEALTRVQTRLQRAIEVWHKMELEDAKLAIDHAKLELYRQRITGQIDLDELIGDDDLEFGEF